MISIHDVGFPPYLSAVLPIISPTSTTRLYCPLPKSIICEAITLFLCNIPFKSSTEIVKIDRLLLNQCHLDKVFYDENSISYAVMH